MIIRRYTCKDMQEAMMKVKLELGSEAVIMSSRKVKPKGLFSFLKPASFEVVAAIDDDLGRPAKKPQAPVQVQTTAISSAQSQAELYKAVLQKKAETMGAPVAASILEAAAQPMAAMTTPLYTPAEQSMAIPSSEKNRVHPQLDPYSRPKAQEEGVYQDLENKVKSMEGILEQILRSVNQKLPSEEAARKGELSTAARGDETEGQAADNQSLEKLRSLLQDQDVDNKLIDKIVEKVKEREGDSLAFEETLTVAYRIMLVLMGEPEPINIKSEQRPHVAMFIGPTGVGKTTTLAKIAADFSLNKQLKVGLITSDTYRIAAVEQLKTYGEILKVPIRIVYTPEEAQEAIRAMSDMDLILVDTAGRSHKNKTHSEELKQLVENVSADETYLVISANASRSTVREVLESYSYIKNYKLLFTKLDEAASPGIIVNARYLTGRPLSYTTAGQSVPDDLEIASPRAIISGLLHSNGVG